MCGPIAGCVVMHPFFAYMQMVGVYDIEQRCGQRLIAEGRLPVAITKGAHILRISHITRLYTHTHTHTHETQKKNKNSAQHTKYKKHNIYGTTNLVIGARSARESVLYACVWL